MFAQNMLHKDISYLANTFKERERKKIYRGKSVKKGLNFTIDMEQL